MALDPIKLDDLTWSEMVVAIRRRIAAASGGKWTLHAPVDPGITLLELFAWLLEQRVFWMDQVPDSFLRGALQLLGETPKATQAAATVMRFTAINNAQILPATTELRLVRSNPPIVFSTESEVALLPFVRLDDQRDKLSLFISGKDGNQDRTMDLEQGKVMKLFPADGEAAEVKIVLWLREQLPSSFTDKRFSLLFDLRDSSSVLPQWSPDLSANAPPPAKITWFYSAAGGKQIQFDYKEIGDGTGGLRRSGLVTLPIKNDWQPESPVVTQGPFQYALRMRVEHTSFTAPPRLERLITNVVIASHKRMTREHALRREWLPLPGNLIALADLPENAAVKDHPAIENTIELQVKERDGNWRRWQRTADLAFHGPEDRVFTVDRERGEVRFGDGLTGRLPVLAKSEADLANHKEPQLKVRYQVGGGSAGKLGANLKWESVDLQAVNVVQTEGGEDAETMAAARERMASTLKQRTRAVTRNDYEEIALTNPGVAIKRAHAAIGFHPAHPCAPLPGAVTVFIVPDAPRPDALDEDSEEFDGTLVESAFIAAPAPDPGAMTEVFTRLGEKRLVASEVFVSAPHYRPVALTLEVESNAIDRTSLSQKTKLRLRKFLDPLIGGDNGDGWPFGEPLRPSAMLREAQRALGDEGSVTGVSVRLLDTRTENASQKDQDLCSPSNIEPCVTTTSAVDAGQQPVSDENCSDVPIGAHNLVELRQLTINFHRPIDGQGGLR